MNSGVGGGGEATGSFGIPVHKLDDSPVLALKTFVTLTSFV